MKVFFIKIKIVLTKTEEIKSLTFADRRPGGVKLSRSLVVVQLENGQLTLLNVERAPRNDRTHLLNLLHQTLVSDPIHIAVCGRDVLSRHVHFHSNLRS